MADVPAAPLEGSSAKSTDTKALLFMTEDDGGGGLRDALFQTIESDVVNGQRLGVVSAAPPVAASTTALAPVVVGAASTQVLVANADRVDAVFTNDDDEPIYLALGVAAVMNRGIRLNSHGGAFEILWSNMFRGAVYAICASGGKTLCVMEVYE